MKNRRKTKLTSKPKVKKPKKIKLRQRAKLANLVANSFDLLINWRPFNIAPMRMAYRIADNVRLADPLWTAWCKQRAHAAEEKAKAAAAKVEAKAKAKALKAEEKAKAITTDGAAPEAA